MFEGVPLANLVTVGARTSQYLVISIVVSAGAKFSTATISPPENFGGVVLAPFPLAPPRRDGRCEPDRGRGGIRCSIGNTVEIAQAGDELAEKNRSSEAVRGASHRPRRNP